MIWYWLMIAIKNAMKLLVPPDPLSTRRVYPNAKCAACGAFDGRLRTVHRVYGPKRQKHVLVEHTCNVCGARTYERPVVDSATPEKVEAAIARDEIERRADMLMLYAVATEDNKEAKSN